MIFFDNVNICPTPNFYVQKMFMTNQGDYYFDNVISKDEKDSTLAGSCVHDSKTEDIILKLVNAGKEPKAMKIDLSDFGSIITEAEQTILEGDVDAENTFENPKNVTPVKSVVNVKTNFEYLTPAMSLTIIRINTEN